MTLIARLFFLLALAAMVFLALTPAPIGAWIESGETRHALAFGLLPLLSAVAWPRLHFIPHLLIYAALGAAIEFAQEAMQVGRKAELDDWITDLIATAVALGFVALIRRVQRTPNPQPSEA